MTIMMRTAPLRSSAFAVAGIALTGVLLVPANHLAAQITESRPAAQPAEKTESFPIRNATRQNDLNDVQTALRNVIPRAHIYALPTQNIIVIRATEEDLEEAHKTLAAIDNPHKAYRITYTITESDGGKRGTPQHYSLIALGDAHTTLKQGLRVPIVTGTTGHEAENPLASQVQYVDVGLNIDVSISGNSLQTKIERTSVSPDKSSVGIQDPVIQQSTLEAASTFTPGNAVVLGSIDVPGSTQHDEIAVTVESLQ